jgi:hypothetical protein
MVGVTQGLGRQPAERPARRPLRVPQPDSTAALRPSQRRAAENRARLEPGRSTADGLRSLARLSAETAWPWVR